MKHIKYLLIYLIVILAPTAFCAEFNLNSYISATYSGNRSKYECYETYQYGSLSHCSFGTRYNGRMGSLKIFIHYPFEEDTNYRLTFNMATDDFRNNFGSAWTWDCDNNTDITNMNSTVWTPTFISYKKAQLSFSLNDNTTCVGVLVRSANYSSDAFTGVNNWNLSNITIYDPDWQSGGSGQGTATPSPSTPDPNQQIIDNANQNTQDVIENNNSNTQSIIDNQNNLLTNKCSNLFEARLPITTACGITVTPNNDGSYTINGTSTCGIDFRLDQAYINGATNLFSLSKGTYTLSSDTLPTGLALNVMQQNTWATYFYNNSNTSIYTSTLNSDVNDLFTYIYIDNNTTFNNFVIHPMLVSGSNSKPYCQYGSSTSNKIDNINDSLTNDNVDSGVGSDFFDSFTNNMHGLSSIITIPLSTIQSLTNAQCSPLTLPIPFTNKNITLPCMTEIYQEHVPLLLSLLRTCWLGIISYKALVDIFAMVKGFKDPDSDKIEVMEL